MNILVTGSSGFVGQNLISFLKKYNIAVKPLIRGNLANINGQLYMNSKAIIHLAGKAHDLKSVSDSDEYYKVNYELTTRLYDEFLKSAAKKFIFISSVKAAADSVKGILTEDMKANPHTHYGKSKLMAEEYIEAQPLPEGKSYYILRPCMIHGPGNKGNLNLLYKFVQKGIPYPLAAFDNRRSFLSVENLCFIIKELTEADIPSGVYNISDDDALSTNEVVAILSRSLNKEPNLLRVSPELVKFLAKIGDKVKLPLNTERLNKLTESYQVSNEKIKTALGVEFPLSAKEGLQLTALSFKEMEN